MKQNMEQQLTQLKRFYLSQLPDKISAIENAWQEYLANPQPDKMQTLYRQIRNMSGSAGTYGYKDLSDIAKKMDKIFREQPHFLEEKKEEITTLIAQLRLVHSKIK